MTIVHTLDIAGARLYCGVCGAGPVLLVIAAPESAVAFAPLTDALALHHTVITCDPRRIPDSSLGASMPDLTPEQQADVLAGLLDALKAEPADVFCTGGGAVTGLALVARHPGRVRALVAHELPMRALLANAAERHAWVTDIVETFHREGQETAWRKFLASPRTDNRGDSHPMTPSTLSEPHPTGQPPPAGSEPCDTIHYVLDIAALATSPTRVLIGVGTAASEGLDTHQSATALAELLGTSPTEFPGDRHGYLGQPDEFAKTLRHALSHKRTNAAFAPFAR